MVKQTVTCEFCTITGVILRGGNGLQTKQGNERRIKGEDDKRR